MADVADIARRAREIRAQAAEILADNAAPRDVRVAAECADDQAAFVLLALLEGEHLASGNALATAADFIETAKRWRQFHELWPDAKAGRHQRSVNAENAKKKKRRQWADALADRISSWDEIPSSYEPLEIETLEADLKLYRDGNEVTCVSGDKISKLARSTFEKRYLRSSLRRRGQKRR